MLPFSCHITCQEKTGLIGLVITEYSLHLVITEYKEKRSLILPLKYSTRSHDLVVHHCLNLLGLQYKKHWKVIYFIVSKSTEPTWGSTVLILFKALICLINVDLLCSKVRSPILLVPNSVYRNGLVISIVKHLHSKTQSGIDIVCPQGNKLHKRSYNTHSSIPVHKRHILPPQRQHLWDEAPLQTAIPVAVSQVTILFAVSLRNTLIPSCFSERTTGIQPFSGFKRSRCTWIQLLPPIQLGRVRE